MKNQGVDRRFQNQFFLKTSVLPISLHTVKPTGFWLFFVFRGAIMY